ncbi:prolyl oligopeptidase family serine peptidase [Luteimonas sp. 8-5]|uniref:S9 family peptidase n=1 Tax=Luteimonas sp. 8-5 TaxID=3039387 RepID=UPI002436316F|nr:prolyl oligopeptidase family serine peptidase [Luteimonas sp. 8-5]MDG6347550.1 prolyl oligopeptidase family serine peptidase [Luteimonas sp. 8-5]
MKHFNAAALVVAFVMAAVAGAADAAERVPIEAFAISDALSSPRLSPDGKHIAVSADMSDGHHAIVVYQVDGMQQTSLLRLPRYQMPMEVHWADDERLLVATGRKIGAREKPVPTGDIIASDYDGKNQRFIFGWDVIRAGIDRGWGVIEQMPRVRNGHFFMRHITPNSNRTMLYDMDTIRSQRLVGDIGARDMDFVLDPSGTPRFAWGWTDFNTFAVHETKDGGKTWMPATANQLDGQFVPYAFSADGKQVYATWSHGGGPSSLVRADPSGANLTTLASDEFGSVGEVEWNTAGEPFAATLFHGRPQMVYFDETALESREHKALSSKFPGLYLTYVNHTSDGNATLLYAYSDRDPGAWYLYDRAKRTVAKLMASRSRIDPARMGERRYVRFPASDGLALDGYLTLPAGVQDPRNMPMVLLPHGGPHMPGDTWAFDNDAQFLASRGYIVLQVNFRGGEGRGYNFKSAGYRQWGTRVQDDLVDGVRWAVAQGYADPQRICSFGGSFGAYSALMVTVRAPGLFRCAVGQSGLYDLESLAEDSDAATSRLGPSYISRVIGDDQAVWRANSPLHLADKIKVPVFLAHGEIDKRTPYKQAVAMKKALERAGNAPQWLSVPGEGHGFYKDENNVEFYTRLEAFLAAHIGAGAAP